MLPKRLDFTIGMLLNTSQRTRNSLAMMQKPIGSTQDRSKHLARFTHKPTRPIAMMSLFIANFLRFEPPEHLFNANMDYLSLQRLTRFRKYIAQQIALEKNYFLNHLFLKFSDYQQVKLFSSVFGVTSLEHVGRSV